MRRNCSEHHNRSEQDLFTSSLAPFGRFNVGRYDIHGLPVGDLEWLGGVLPLVDELGNDFE